MRFSVLASGSMGNACYVETTHSRILIDAGLSAREITRRLESVHVRPSNLDALFVTHEHTDHIKGLGSLARRLDISVFGNHATLMRCVNIVGNIPRPVPVRTGETITLNDLSIETFTKCHDALDPVGIIISSDGKRLGVLTDLGRSTLLVEDRMKGCQALIMEFNHDRSMLEEGPYHLDLKRRIRGPNGHLSNDQAGDLLGAVCHRGLKVLVPAHLSKVNNLPERAYDKACQVLNMKEMDHVRIIMSHQDRPTPMVDL